MTAETEYPELGTCAGGPFSHDPTIPHQETSLCKNWHASRSEVKPPACPHERRNGFGICLDCGEDVRTKQEREAAQPPAAGREKQDVEERTGDNVHHSDSRNSALTTSVPIPVTPAAGSHAECKHCGGLITLVDDVWEHVSTLPNLHLGMPPEPQAAVRAPETADQFWGRQTKRNFGLFDPDERARAFEFADAHAAERVAALTAADEQRVRDICRLTEQRDKAEADLAEARRLAIELGGKCYYAEGGCFFCGERKSTTHKETCIVQRLRAALRGVSQEEKK